MVKYTSKHKEKICNRCGEDTLDYTVVDNAPICKDCLPKPKKVIPSESKMFDVILNQKLIIENGI